MYIFKVLLKTEQLVGRELLIFYDDKVGVAEKFVGIYSF